MRSGLEGDMAANGRRAATRRAQTDERAYSTPGMSCPLRRSAEEPSGMRKSSRKKLVIGDVFRKYGRLVQACSHGVGRIFTKAEKSMGLDLTGGGLKRSRLGRSAWAMVLACAMLPGISLGQATPRELRQEANTKLARGAFVDAIPDLQQLIQYLGESKDARIKSAMESVFYNLAICYFFVGQFDEAEVAFKDYIKRYPYGSRTRKAVVYIADALRFKGSLKDALKAYEDALKKYGAEFTKDIKADIYSAMARCHLAEDDWKGAMKPLMDTYNTAPDFLRRNWAATLLVTGYFKELDLDKVYPLTPYFLRPDSFASRSVAFNMAALEAGDELFADERYRDALWVHRMVYPHDMVLLNTEAYLGYLQRQAENMKGRPGDPRLLMRIQESIGELEEELKAINEMPVYDIELLSRIARGYKEMLRFWEGREIFLHLNTVAEPKLAEESLFLAFLCSTKLLPWSRAYEIGEDYMRLYPAGEYFDPLTLLMGQMYAKEQNWKKTIEHLKKALEISPKHESSGECFFLIGYASFMEEIFDQAIDYFTRIVKQFPENELVPPSTYWTAMSYLFDGKYEEAAPWFDRVLKDYPTCMYVEDSAFRRAVCDYGMSNYEDADKRLAAFIAAYPRSLLISEGIMMRADVAGSMGRLDDGVRMYRQAMSFPDFNIEFYNHCAFQAGRILSDNEDYPGMIAHYRKYIEDNREGSNIPLAVYWTGVALWNQGEQEGAMQYYRSAVEQYGKDRTTIGTDIILDEWVGRTKRATPEQSKKAWAELAESLSKAMRTGDKVTELRLKRVMLYHPAIQPPERERIIDSLLDETNLQYASPAVLQSILDYARERRSEDLMVKAAKHIIEIFTETDYALDARMVLADRAITLAKTASETERRNQHYAEAVKHLDVIRTVFAASADAAQALMLLAQIYYEQGKYDKADECYKQVLGVKEWKNFWPEALYGRGECSVAQKQFETASAYYERIYVMYGHYRKWTAKSYLRRAECLRRLFRNDKAIEVLNEMLADKELAGTPEGAEAREMLTRIKG